MSNENRTHAGVPTGGQYAASEKGEADAVTLLEPADQDLIAEALGDGPDLDADEQRLLAILLDEDVNRDCGNDTDLDVVVEDLTYQGEDDGFYGAERIADRLHAHYERQSGGDGAGGFDFEVNTTGDYDYASYSLGVYLGTRDGVWLRDTQDSKYLSVDRNMTGDPTGLRKAVALASVLDGDFQRLRAKAQRLGLLPAETPADKPDLYTAKQALAAYDATPEDDDVDVDTMAALRDTLAAYVAAEQAPRPAVWPQNADERAAFEDYRTEVSNGDTAVSFRDWYTNRDESGEDD